MTNREKYIDKVSNEKLAEFIIKANCERCDMCLKKDKCQKMDRDVIESECYKGIEQWLSQEAESTADEMFEELQYAIQSEDNYTIKYRKITKTPYVEIRLHRNTQEEWEYEKYFVEEDNQSELITQKEDKAIHKKIEELKKKC